MPLTKPQLAALFADKLAASGLDARDAKKLGFAPALAAPAELPYPCAGFTLPYRTLDGKPTKFYRYRYLEDTRRGFDRVRGAKPTRYAQPPSTAPELYIPPLIDWKGYLADTGNRLVFTEGELKSACATKHGLPTLGLGGVWSFRSKKAKMAVLPIFKHLALKDRECVIAFDSDAAANPEIRRAEVFFAEELGKLGAIVSIARVPELEPGTKTGLDDFIVARGAEALLTEVIAGAQPYEATARLHALNTEVCVVTRPGFVFRLEDRHPMNVSDFVRLHYAAWQHVDYSDPEKPKTVQTADAWLRWPQRAEVRALTYAPGQSELTQDGALNLWAGWPREPRRGSVKPWEDLLDYIFGHDAAARRWFERWAAFPLQNPGFKLRTATVLWGRHKGTGKSLVGYTLGRIYGSNFAEIDDSAIDPNRPFNSWAKNKQFALVDDITGHSNRRLANKLKVMVTREHIEINEKNIREYSIPDCINYLFTANDPDAFYLEDGDRRFFIHEVLATPAPRAFYDAYDAWYKSDEGAAALFDHLLRLDLGDFHPLGEPPLTAAKLEMTAMSKTELEAWIAAALREPDAYLAALPGDLFTPEELCALYDPSGNKDVSPVLMARKLAVAGAFRVTPRGIPSGQIKSTVRGKLVRLYALRNVDRWRRPSVTADTAREHYDAARAQFIKVKKF